MKEEYAVDMQEGVQRVLILKKRSCCRRVNTVEKQLSQLVFFKVPTT
jgi:hypothetical protein